MIIHVKGEILRANVALDTGAYDENRRIMTRKPFVSAVLMIRVTHTTIGDSIEFVTIEKAKGSENFEQLYKSSFDYTVVEGEIQYIDIIVSSLDKDLPKNYSSQCLALLRDGDLIKAELSVKETEGIFNEPNNSIIWLNLLPRRSHD